MERDRVGQWVIGPFMHDPSDESLFWEERTDDGHVRLGNTGPWGEGIYIAGRPTFPPGRFTLPLEPEAAREHYLRLCHEIERHLKDRHLDQ